MAFPCNRVARGALLAWCSFVAFAQVPEKMVGSVSAIALEKATLDVKGQDGTPVTIHLTTETILQRVAPGEKSLKNAETIQVSDIAVGDKVLVNSDPASGMARRLVVMSAKAISKHDEADKMAWTTKGISGIVTAKTGDDLTLRLRTLQGEVQAHVLVSKETGFRKYAADSVRFGDAKVSSLAEVSVGDQLRARGDKSEDGLKVTANEIVFGTFVTKAGTITAIDPEHKSVSIKELNTNKPFNVKLTADSQLKQMPNFAAMFAGGGMPGGGAPGAGAPSAGGPPNGMPAAAGGPAGGMRRAPDIAQMVERMPTVALDALKVGDTVVMSSTKGAVDNEYTAIVLLDNAEMLIRMATAQRPAGAAGAGGAVGGMQGGGQGMGGGMGAGGLGGLDLPGIMQ
jgi:transcription antitermination factor NusG